MGINLGVLPVEQLYEQVKCQVVAADDKNGVRAGCLSGSLPLLAPAGEVDGEDLLQLPGCVAQAQRIQNAVAYHIR